jgi:hypothetical protein
MAYTDILYPHSTGVTKTAVDSGQHTRHYASDGSSPTHDWEVTGWSPKNYEATCQQNIPGDELSIKMWGPDHSTMTLTSLCGLMETAAGISFR